MKRFLVVRALAWCAIVAAALTGGTKACAQGSPTVQVLSSNAVREVLSELIPEFERVSGTRVSVTYETTNGVVSQVRSGAAADLVIISAEAIDGLIEEGKLVRGSRVDIAKSGIGVAVRAGAAVPDIGSAEGLKAALLAARSVAIPRNGLTATHFLQVLDRLGIGTQMRPKLVEVESGPVGPVVASGNADIGLQQISELLPVAGITIVGPLPGDFQRTTTFSSAISSGARMTLEARALVNFLTQESAAAVIRGKGMER